MGENTKIEWCDHTFNPWIGCTAVSPACDHCYAERYGKRIGVEWGPHGERRRTSAANWKQPLRWDRQARIKLDAWEKFIAANPGLTDTDLTARGFVKPRRPRVFCASLADVFDNAVPNEWRADLFTLIKATPYLDWLLLTKRIGNAAKMLSNITGPDPDLHKSTGKTAWKYTDFPNVWIGATVCNQEEADRDIPKLLAVSATRHFLSIEPMLGPIEIDDFLQFEYPHCDGFVPSPHYETGYCDKCAGHENDPIHKAPRGKVDWVICGGETGPHARPMHPNWVRSLRDQCAAAGAPFFFKQWGEWLPISEQTEHFTNKLYRSNRKAEPHEDQAMLDDIYGRTCTVKKTVIHKSGSTHELSAPMAHSQDADPMLTFMVGKSSAGRVFDKREWNEVPA